MKIGTKVRTLYQYSETAVVVRPRRGESTEPGWVIIRWDSDRKRACCSVNMLAVRND